MGNQAPDLDTLHAHDLRDQAAVLELRYRKQNKSLTAEVAKQLSSERYSLAHGLLASLGVKEAVTTNYDRLYELAVMNQHNKRLAILPYEPVQPGQRWLLKVHGSIDRADDLVFTRKDYMGAPVTRGALFGIVQALLMTRHMLFIGYSLNDEDFHLLVHEVRNALISIERKQVLGTVLTLFENPFFTDLWCEDLDICAMLPASHRPPGKEEIGIAAREQEILLDRVAFLAADLDRFLLDPTYESMLNEKEFAVRDALTDLSRHLPRKNAGKEWIRIKNLLNHFGYKS